MHSARGRSEQAHWGIEWKFFTDGISKHISDSSQVTKKKRGKDFLLQKDVSMSFEPFFMLIKRLVLKVIETSFSIFICINQ